MVTAAVGFVVVLWSAVLGLGQEPGAVAPTPDSNTASAGEARAEVVRTALAREGYPWYDAGSDRVKPVLPQPDFEGGFWKRLTDWLSNLFRPIGNWFKRLNRWHVPGIGGLGDVVAVGLALLLLTVVLVGLLELLRRYRPLVGGEDGRVTVQAGRAQRIEGLPAGVRLGTADPWAEAQRLRARGDYAGAVVHLFAHQLLSLERARQVRLVPGRTGRQLVRSVADRTLRAPVEPTLRLFEQVYYGHRAPPAESFEAVWAQALAFERLIAPRAAEAAP
jgi:hypothetical protein